MSEGIEIHAGLVIVGILAADEIAGVPGMFLAVPFLAAMKVVLEHVRRNRSAAADEKGGPRAASCDADEEARLQSRLNRVLTGFYPPDVMMCAHVPQWRTHADTHHERGNGMRENVFEFPGLERVIYGKPAAAALAGEVERLGVRRVFLVVSGTMNRTTDEVDKVRAALGDRYAATYDGIPPFNPRSAVLKAAELARSVGTDLVVTFGGGSVTKRARSCGCACSTTLRTRMASIDFAPSPNRMARASCPSSRGPRIPQIAIPTTLSAGELTTGGGAMDERVKRKFSHENAKAIPRTVIFDPAPTVHTPLWVWLSTRRTRSTMRTEGLCSPHSNPISDGMYQQALKLLSSSLLTTKRDPADLEARLQRASTGYGSRSQGATAVFRWARVSRDRPCARRLVRRAAWLHLLRDAAARAALRPCGECGAPAARRPKHSAIRARMPPT